MDNKKFGEFVKNLREKEKMTQKELGEKLNVTDKAVSKWERGLSFPDIEILNSLSKTFDVTVQELLNGELQNNEKVQVEDTQKLVEEMKKSSRKKITLIIILGLILILILITFMAIHFSNNQKEEDLEQSSSIFENTYVKIPDRIIYKNDKNEYFILTPNEKEFNTIYTEVSSRIDSTLNGKGLKKEEINNIKQNGKFIEFDYNTKSKNKIFPLDEKEIAMISMGSEDGQVSKVSINNKDKLIEKVNKLVTGFKTYRFDKNNVYNSTIELSNLPSELEYKEKTSGIYQLIIEDKKTYDKAINETNFTLDDMPDVNFEEQNVVITISKFDIASIEENIGNIKYNFISDIGDYKVSMLVVSKVVNVNCIYCTTQYTDVYYEYMNSQQNTLASATGIIENLSEEFIEVGFTNSYLTHLIVITDDTTIEDYTTKEKLNINDLKVGDCIYIEGTEVTPDNDLTKIEAKTILICRKEIIKNEIERYIQDTYTIDGLGIEYYYVDENGDGYIILVGQYEFYFEYPMILNVNAETETYLGMGYHLSANYGYVLHEMCTITVDTKITDIDNIKGYVKLIEYIAD